MSHAREHHAELKVAGDTIRCVHMDDQAKAQELMMSRLRSVDQGRKQFRKRVRKAPQQKPQQLAPLVSTKVVEADTYGS